MHGCGLLDTFDEFLFKLISRDLHFIFLLHVIKVNFIGIHSEVILDELLNHLTRDELLHPKIIWESETSQLCLKFVP